MSRRAVSLKIRTIVATDQVYKRIPGAKKLHLFLIAAGFGLRDMCMKKFQKNKING